MTNRLAGDSCFHRQERCQNQCAATTLVYEFMGNNIVAGLGDKSIKK
jgi:hypothetical protein